MKNKFILVFLLLAIALQFSFNSLTTFTYNVDTKSSKIVWTANKVTGSHTGNILISSGQVKTDGKAMTGGSFVIDMNSITCTDITDSVYNAKLIRHLKSDDFFSIEKFKTSKFEIISMKSLGGERYEITGNLTIKGITNKVVLPISIKITDSNIVAIGTAKIDRTKFDIKYNSGSFFENLGDKAIRDEFDLQLNIIARKN